ncbi:hypothetical protein [Actinokineospora sp. UTMC 2448]|uniref:hypothetical protein n=1 Tax=Actinokineospora sp. UTMC 2448 TaxID=2268449 RepID=UPI0021644C83|nr:hypothetical protein [Actinokineospora sp. UTMC 2448]UVS81742.1 hypothetical protein Actkin_05506 [Actinokineospora sp. UTMC 2448]
MLPTGSDTRVVELRVHGMMGTTPESLVSAVAAVDVAGDGLGRVVRPADRLLRPAPGPVLRAEGRSVPRVVEGYVWGAMTSGGWAKATWALLFPFALANMAHWMLPPAPRGHRPARLLGGVLRALLRLAALLLTVLFVVQATVVTYDLLAVQCLAPGADCLGWVPDWLRRAYPFRQAVSVVPVLLLVLVLHRVSCVAWETPSVPNPPEAPPNVRVDLPGRNLVADPDTPALRTLHLVAALAAVALALGGPFAAPDPVRAFVPWVVALALLGVCVAGTLLLDDPRGVTPGRGGRWLRAAFGHVPGRVLEVLGVLAVLAAAGAVDPVPAVPRGTGITVDTVAAALIVVIVLFGVLLAPAALFARRTWRELPRGLRPWAGGWMAAPVIAVAGLLGGGFGAGLAITLRTVIGFDAMNLPPGYTSVTLLWGAGGVLAIAVAIPSLAVAAVRLLRGGHTAEADLLGADDEARRAWRLADWQRRNLHRIVLASAAFLAAGTVVAVTMRLLGREFAPWLAPFSAMGVLALGLLAGSLLRAVQNAAREPEAGRRLGILADLACFWPREAHPAVPPCYALKVVPELATRAAEHLRDPQTRVVLTGHSQGSLLVVVAAARMLDSVNEPERLRLGLVTVGSQVQWAYLRAFPSVVPFPALAATAAGFGTRWRSLCRGTDPMGGAVLTWNRQAVDGKLLGTGLRPDGTVGPLPAAVRSPTDALVLGADHWLPDPMHGPFPGRRWSPGVQAGKNYTADPEWDRAVAMAAGLDPDDVGGLPWPTRRLV